MVAVVLVGREGSTPARDPPDPGEARGLLEQFYDLTRRVVERCGVPVSHLLGKGVLAVFEPTDAHPGSADRGAGPDRTLARPRDPLLSRLPFFADCTPEELAPLTGTVQRRFYRRGEVIFREGDPSTGIYVVEQGLVKVGFTSADGKERTLALLGPGEVVGEIPVLDDGVHSADGVAQDDCVVAFVTREELVDWLRHRPEAALRLIHLMGQRLRAANLQIRDAAFLDVHGRLARVLLELAAGRSGRSPDGGVLCPRLRQAELAHMVGATRESVNRWLRWFERVGAIRRERGRITVLLDRLRREVY